MGYYQIKIHPDSQHKTAFITKYGQFSHVRLGFGLCNAPATFQRAIQLVLRGLLWEEVLAYLYDIIVLGRDFNNALANLQKVLDRFRHHNLKLKPPNANCSGSKLNFLEKSLRKMESVSLHLKLMQLPLGQSQIHRRNYSLFSVSLTITETMLSISLKLQPHCTSYQQLKVISNCQMSTLLHSRLLKLG